MFLVTNENMGLCLYMRAQGQNAQCMGYHNLSSALHLMVFSYVYTKQIRHMYKVIVVIGASGDSNPQSFDLEANALPTTPRWLDNIVYFISIFNLLQNICFFSVWYFFKLSFCGQMLKLPALNSLVPYI